MGEIIGQVGAGRVPGAPGSVNIAAVGDTNLIEKAAALFHRAFEAQMRGDLAEAVSLYRQSLDVHPTAEAHTFLGWTYSFQGELEGAIAECRRAIEVDPSFGNPYNDIGAYLIEQGRLDDAIPWLEKAKLAPRYEAPHYPCFNLARVYVAQELYAYAQRELEEALALRPGYAPAQKAMDALKRKVH
jgi:Tfp pilus assembly protein PilF